MPGVVGHHRSRQPPSRRAVRRLRQSGDPHRAGAAASRAGGALADADRGVSTRDRAAGWNLGMGAGARRLRLPRRPSRAATHSMPAVPHESRHVHLKHQFREYAAECFGAGQAHPVVRERALRPAVPGPDLCAGRDHHQHLGHRGAGAQARCLPGLRAPDDRLPALARTAGALRQRLPAHHRSR